MTDLEMVKLCAQALDLPVFVNDRGAAFLSRVEAPRFAKGGGTVPRFSNRYDPLTDKAQCFELVERFRLVIDHFVGEDGWQVSSDGQNMLVEDADLSRAIVTCVAKMELRKAEGR